MDNPITVDYDKVAEHIHSEDFEKDQVIDMINQAYAYLNKYLYSQGMSVSEYSNDNDYRQMYIRSVLFIVSMWYQNAEGSEPASVAFASKIPGGLKMILETMRTPNL